MYYKSISDATEKEKELFKEKIQIAITSIAEDLGFGGLSVHGFFDFYSAIDEAIDNEFTAIRELKRG